MSSEFTQAPVNCSVFFENIQSVPEEEYAMIRRNGLGASDSSVMLGLMTKFNKNTQGLIEEKLRTFITDEEKEIGKKDSVRMGKDLEDLNLQKFGKLHGYEKPVKPQHMYSVNDFEYLTVNFDGVLLEKGVYIPVECKFVTTYGDKGYNRDFSFEREFQTLQSERWESRVNNPLVQPRIGGLGVSDLCRVRADFYGIPSYYYSQLQQQMLALDSPYGYLSALHQKGWELVVYKVPRDEKVIAAIKIEGYKVWEQIKRRRGV